MLGVFEGDGLRYAVVGEEEIGGVEGLEEGAFWSADEGGDNDEVGGGGILVFVFICVGRRKSVVKEEVLNKLKGVVRIKLFSLGWVWKKRLC